ncbi:MAG: zinc-binding dehydrogenase [Calditrichia bacterium]|nr:zinc-binding dehydrogenase [Calditrichia bacterium]
MKTMHAIVFQEEKNFDSLQIREAPYPEPQPGEAVVRIRAAALNRRDVWITQGRYPNVRVPLILGSDGAGIVEQVGEGVDPKWLGQAVIINPALDWGNDPRVQQSGFRILGVPDDGTQAEYVRVPARNLWSRPEYLTFEEAAALPLGGLTGYRALFTRGQLAAGETVLITGVGGGVAALMLQMALAAGAAALVTSASDDKIQRAVQAGAKGGANYRTEGWEQEILRLAGDTGVDLIIDSAGGEGFDKLIEIVKPGGRIVLFGITAGRFSRISLNKVYWRQISILGTTMGSEADFAQMVQFFQTQHIKPAIDGVYPFSRFREAYQRMMQGEQFGKIVLAPDFD